MSTSPRSPAGSHAQTSSAAPFGPLLRWPHRVILMLFLAAVTVAAYWRVGECGFVNLADDVQVQHQPMVNLGLRSAGVAWAFTAPHDNGWQPLAILSHLVDCTLFGVQPAPMHRENLLWHVLNSLLVFVVWRALTGATWRPAVVAALFALHPLQVESVAWISQRGNLLGAFFWLLGLWAYARYSHRRSGGSYVLVAAALVLALLAQPMAVTFPCLLLLLDFWPLRRWPERSGRALFIEKLPLFALAIVHGSLALLVMGAAGNAEPIPFGARVGNALVAYVRYVGKTSWPEALAPMYSHPGYWPTAIVAGCLALLALASAFIWWLRRSRPWLAFGWFWFLVTLAPAIGLVQVGAHAMADRHVYVPILGLFTLAAWQMTRVIYVWPRVQGALIAATVGVILGLGFLTARQVDAWKSSISLHQHSLAIGEDNAAVRYRLGLALQAAGRPRPDVAAQFERALQHRADDIDVLMHLAHLALADQRLEEARRIMADAVRYEPANADVHARLGALNLRLGKQVEAERHFREALRLDPGSASAHLQLGQIELGRYRVDEALVHYEARVRAHRWDADAHCDYGTLLSRLGRFDAARAALERAVWLRPDLAAAKQGLEALPRLTPATPTGAR